MQRAPGIRRRRLLGPWPAPAPTGRVCRLPAGKGRGERRARTPQPIRSASAAETRSRQCFPAWRTPAMEYPLSLGPDIRLHRSVRERRYGGVPWRSSFLARKNSPHEARRASDGMWGPLSAGLGFASGGSRGFTCGERELQGERAPTPAPPGFRSSKPVIAPRDGRGRPTWGNGVGVGRRGRAGRGYARTRGRGSRCNTDRNVHELTYLVEVLNVSDCARESHAAGGPLSRGRRQPTGVAGVPDRLPALAGLVRSSGQRSLLPQRHGGHFNAASEVAIESTRLVGKALDVL